MKRHGRNKNAYIKWKKAIWEDYILFNSSRYSGNWNSEVKISVNATLEGGVDDGQIIQRGEGNENVLYGILALNHVLIHIYQNSQNVQ